MNLYFKKYLFLLLVLLNAFFLKASNNPTWVDSLIKEGTAYLIQAQKDNFKKSENNNYTIILDAKKWLGELPDNSDSYSPSLQQNKWHYETGTAYSLTDGISEQQIESRLDSFNTARPTGDNLRFYSILIKNFPVKVNNTIASLPNIDSSKNLFNQLVALKVIDKAYYNNVVRNTFKAVIDKIVSDALAQFTYQELAVYGIGHMVVTYGTNSEDVIGFMAQYPVLKGGRLDSPQTNEYIRTSFNQIANKTTTPRKMMYEMISVWAESIHCVVDENCAPLADPGNTYYNTWKNKQGISQPLIRLTAQYINLLQTNLYNDFKTVRDVPSPSWTNAQFENYKTQVSMFYRYYQHFNEKIDSIDNPKDMIVLCKHLTTNQYQLFTAQQRLKILSKINESSLTDLQNSLSFLNNGYGGENIAVKLVKYAPASQSTVLLAGLKQNNLLNNLLDKLDDAGIGADNFTQFVFGILNLIPQSSFDGNWDNLINNNKIFKGDYSGSLLTGNAFTINLNEQNNNGTLKVITQISYFGYSEKVLSPFEPVGIITNHPLPKYDATANLQGYYEAAVPALYLYWLKEKAETQANYALANVSVNLLGSVTGIGVATNATTWTVRILGALDATSGAIAAGLDVVPVKQAIANKYGANSPEHDFITKIQLGLTIYNGVSAGANLLQLPQKLDEAVIYWNQNKQRLQDDLAVTQQQANQIDNLLLEVNVSGAGKWLDDLDVLLGAGTKTKINGWINNGLSESKLQTAFANSTDKAGLMAKLETSKSIYHQRVHIADWDNIPGIIKSNYVSNGLSSGKTHPAWNNPALDLPSLEAANFVNATAVELPAGTKIYRVTGGNPAGGYWTIQKPNSVGEVIGGTAVQPTWNDFSKMYVYEVPQGQTLKVWQGTTAKQPIAQGVINPHLPGGDQQLFIPDIIRDNSFKNLVQQVTLPW